MWKRQEAEELSRGARASQTAAFEHKSGSQDPTSETGRYTAHSHDDGKALGGCQAKNIGLLWRRCSRTARKTRSS